MHFSTWLLFTGTTLLLAFTPGPAVLLAISTSVTAGPGRAMLGSLGNAAGVFVVSAVSMAGLGVVLGTSATAFMVLKVLGAGYLVYLGVRQWRSKANAFAAPTDDSTQRAYGRSSMRLFGHGVTVAVTNPKSILFFSALFPQFLTPDASLVEQFFVLTATFAACSVLSHGFYVLLARGIKRSFSNVRRVRLFNRVSGATFVVLGVGMLRLRAKAS
ncbi:MAG: LysE family translocator [Comamonadaceae bacterium]|nr:MAG: LysE family translocator [Comamonadaceae bacterium]